MLSRKSRRTKKLIELCNSNETFRAEALLKEGDFILSGEVIACITRQMPDFSTVLGCVIATEGHGNSPVLTELVEMGLSGAEKLDRGHCGFIHSIIRSRMTDVLAALIRKGADLNLTDNDGQTPLLYAVRYPKIHSDDKCLHLRMLLEGGANSEIKDKLGRTPLTFPVDPELPWTKPEHVGYVEEATRLLQPR